MSTRHSSSPIRRVLFALGILAVLGVAGGLRFAHLGERPIHFDESTGARILGDRLAGETYTFDPAHFHGPLLSFTASTVTRLRGESSWNELTTENLRLGVALFSLLTVIGALAIGRFGGRGDGLAAAAFTATCPLLAYYGRMYIHEPLFTAFGLFTLLALLAFLRRPGAWPAIGIGVGAGLMAATRETFVISLFAWAVAALAWPWPTQPGESRREQALRIVTQQGRYLLLPLLIGLGLVGICYSDFGRHPAGVLDFVRTYLDYSLIPGHEKPFHYYLELLLWPRERGGLWWSEGGVLLVALVGYARCPAGPARATCRFMVHAGILHLAVFSILAYKTPWLPCLGWLHLCLAAGMGAGHLVRGTHGPARLAAVAALAALLGWQSIQCHRAVFRFSSDVRNPYAYVPTAKDAGRMADWLNDLAGQSPRLRESVVTVVGAPYWPLPWYLRSFDQVGYWQTLPDDAASRPLILLVSAGQGPDTAAIESSHAFFPRGLRHEVLVTVALRKDVWEATQTDAAP